MKFKTVKHVTLPLLKIKPNGAPVFVRFENPMFTGKKIDDNKPAAILAHVIDLETGEECQIICAKLLQDQLNESYPDNKYVGKSFRITLTKVPEKRYNLVGLMEIEVDPDDIGQGRERGGFDQATDSSNVQTVRQVADKAKGKRK